MFRVISRKTAVVPNVELSSAKILNLTHTVLCFLGALFMTSCATQQTATPLPDYVPTDHPALHKPAKKLDVPLKGKDLEDLTTLEAKYDAEENCSGLAAPQLGIDKAIIIFAVPNDPKLKKFRPDLDQSMPKTIWINPSYEPVGKEMRDDWEGCFSVSDIACLVQRYTTIRYSAYDYKLGKHVEGEATGFLARVIQHEIDHTRGILCKDIAKQTMDVEHYRAMRKRLIEQK